MERCLFLVGDDCQRIYDNTEGLPAVRGVIPKGNERTLRHHYRVAPEICQVADRILIPPSGVSLTSTALYDGTKPARVSVHAGALTKERQLDIAVSSLKEQIRVYGDFIKQGDRIGVVVAPKKDRDLVLEALDGDAALRGKAKIIKSMSDEDDDDYNPSFDSSIPICILTVKGCKGLEFRAVHWLFADALSQYHNEEHYYTVVTRAKTSLDISYTNALPQILARAHSETGVTPW